MMTVSQAQRLVAQAKSVVVMSGAGASTASGIPDFRGPDGRWTRDPEAEKISTLSYYLGDPSVRLRAWQYRLHSPVWTAMPNQAHGACVALERQGRLRAIITQNTDGLHQLAGSSSNLVFEVHGSMRNYRCEKCGKTGPMTEMVDRVRDGEADPRCAGRVVGQYCGGIVRATTVLFEEALPDGVIDDAIEAVSTCDLLIAMGTSLSVYPIAGLVPLAKRCGATVVIVNQEPTGYDDIADFVLRGSAEVLLPELVRLDRDL